MILNAYIQLVKLTDNIVVVAQQLELEVKFIWHNYLNP